MKNGAACLFVLDFVEDGIADFLDGLDVRSLYDGAQDELDPHKDAQRFLNIAKVENADWVIVDDYRLGEEWESPIQEVGYKVCVIDDLLRKHQCDLLIDFRWRGEKTQSLYDSQVPPEARKLLGPDYVLLSEVYRNAPPQKSPDKPFTILLGLGGGGPLDQCERILDSLLLHALDYEQEIRLCPILGPLSPNTESFLQRYQNCKTVTPIVGETELYPHLCQADFYIGAAGGILYQLLALKVPALTFPLSENQHTDLGQLEDIGHFFHVENWSENNIEKLPAFVKTVMQNEERIKLLHATPKVPLDALGTRRVAHVLLGLEPCAPPAKAASSYPDDHGEELSPGYCIRPVTDRDMNHFLVSRNLNANCQNMIRANKISFMDHYSWWFKTKRSSFLLTKNGAPCLYIWHEVLPSHEQDYLIGGWFVCNENAGFQDVMLLLNWQLEYCDKHVPGVPWIAVIHRQNKYVKLMNDYYGFQDVDPATPYGAAIADIFEGAHLDEFYFVSRAPSPSNPNEGLRPF
ncbi:hypothetical protein BEN30_02565 [Magnetovibrio blakemorei]|uniref:Glycosyl transferase family 28 C-terminal domain-containing protein n=2 Tax=Magnetovibrio blakemorei TaxID=28181 RepID=A0A1E5QBZ6_9PROT|nr:hypothetical protein BEN30_02565 [Magnetovibrio blakemorei]